MEPLRLASLWSRALAGAKAIPVAVEVHLGNGLPQFQIVGLPDTEVRESRERVRVALQASGFEFPMRRITVNLAPADLPKESGRFDLPIALGILMASGQLPSNGRAGRDPAALEFVGELALDGSLRAVRGGLAMAVEAGRCAREMVMPAASADEAAVFPDLPVLAAESLAQVCRHLLGQAGLPPAQGRTSSGVATEGTVGAAAPPDLREVCGQAAPRRALEVAAAGGHSLLLHGPPGCGKTLLAERLAGLLPPLSREEAIAHAINRSLAGLPMDASRLYQRPCRRPHHTTPAIALTGGGRPMRPGEMSLAHCGVLFLDEVPEFSRMAIEALREPLESGVIHLARVAGGAAFPAEFQLVCTMNPCPCGRPPDVHPPCRCTPEQIRLYRAKLSLPLLDRIDLWVPVRPTSTTELSSKTHEDSETVRSRVCEARAQQLARQGCCNARLRPGDTLVAAALGVSESRLWHRLAAQHRLSARGAHRLLRVARTLADLSAQERVGARELEIAASWRTTF